MKFMQLTVYYQKAYKNFDINNSLQSSSEIIDGIRDLSLNHTPMAILLK